jgi:RNA polymerase-binding transcription factor DksA
MTDTAAYKAKLTEALSRVARELETLGIHNKDNPKDWIATPEPEESAEPDPNDVADRVEEWDEKAATLSTLEREYNDITRAIKKIEGGTYGTYGICEISGEEIETDRLDANPAARTCKTHMEKEVSLPQ